MSNRHRAPAVPAVPGANPPFQHQQRPNLYHQAYTPQVSSAASATNGPVMYNHHGAVVPPGNHNPHHPAAAHHAHQYSTTTPPPVVQGGAPAAAGQPGQRLPYYSLPPNGAGGRMPHQGGPRMPLGPRMNQPPPSAGGNGGTSHPPPHPHQQPPTYAQIPSQLHHGMYPQQVPQLILHHHAYPRFPGAPPVSGQGYYPQAHPGMHPQPGMAPLMAGAPMTYPPQGGQFAGYGQQFAMQMAQVPVPPATQPPPPGVAAAQTAAPPPPQSQTAQQQQQQQQQAAAAAAAAAAQQPPATVAAGAPPGQPRPGPGQTPPTFHQPPQQAYVAPNMYNSGPHQGHPYQQQPPVTTVSGGLPAAKQPPKRRSQAIKIINPDSGRNVLDDLTKGSEEAKKEEANATKRDGSGPVAGGVATEKDQRAAVPAPRPDAGSAAAGVEPLAAAAADPAAAVKNSIRDEFTRKVAAAAAAAPKATQPGAASESAAPQSKAAASAVPTKPIHSENTLKAPSSSSLSNSNSHPTTLPPHRQSSVDQVTLSAAPVAGLTPPDTPSPPKSNDVIKGAEPVSPTPLPPPTPNSTDSKKEQLSAPKPDESIQPASAAPKQGSKKSASAKKAELNSKGALGSDMDAFTDLADGQDSGAPATAKSEEKKPEPVNHVSPDKTVDLSSSTSSLTSTDTLPVKEDVTLNHKEETTPPPPAAAPQAQVPAAAPASVKPPGGDQVIDEAPMENGTAGSQSGSQIKLKYNYKEGQWSPCNPEGKKQYDRDFLHALSKDPKSLVKPMNLPQMDIIKDKANPAKINSAFNKNPGLDFMPNFIKQTISRGPGGGGSLTKRGSRDGRDAKRSMGGPGAAPGPGRIISLQIPSTQVELHKTENAWKPGQKAEKGNAEEEDPLAEVSKQTLAILNKLTPQKFDKLLAKFNEINIDTEAKLRKCMELIFEKAVDEPGFAVEYAKMCKNLQDKKIKDPVSGELVNFRKLLITRCQIEFQKDYMEGIDPQKLKEEIAKAESEDEKKRLQEEFNDKEKKARRRSSGNTRFIGELYKLEMLTVRIMHECIRGLIKKEDEESLECLCTLVTSIGKVLEESTLKRQDPKNKNPQHPQQHEVVNLDIYFAQMKQIVDQKKTSSRIRCLLLDLIELRVNKWVPRRKVAGPKTIDQIHKDIEKDRNQQQLADLAYQGGGGPSKSLGGNYGRDRGGPQNDGRKKSSQRIDNDGWSQPVKTTVAKPQEKYDPRMNPFASSGSTQSPFIRDPFNRQKESGGLGAGAGLVLGRGPSNFSSWGKGSGSKMSNAGAPSVNRFDALSMQSSERSASPGPGGRMASRSVQGNMGGGRSDYGRNEALQAVKNFGKQSVPNGPGMGPGYGGAPAPAASSAAAAMRLEIGKTDDLIAVSQSEQLKGDPKLFANLDDEDTKELFQRRVVGILKEYIDQPSTLKEAILSIKESCKREHMTFAVEQWVQHVLEAKAGSREKLGYFLVVLVKEELLQRVQVFHGMSNTLEFAEEMICDIPKYWDYFGELIAPMLESRYFAMNLLPETIGKMEGDPCDITGKYVEAVLRKTVLKTGNKIKVAEMWNEACLSWKTFLPEDKIDDFLSKRKIKEDLEFTLSSSSPSSGASNSSSSQQDPSKMSHDQIRSELTKLLDNSIPPQKEALTNFVDTYVKTCKDEQPDNAFIRIVTTAVVKSCLSITKQENSDPSQQNIKCDFQDGMFEEKAWFLRRLLDGKPNRQIQSIYAMVTLMIELEHPSRVLVRIFEALHQNDLVSTETFFAWEKCDDPAQQESKGVAIKSTIPFFTFLKEGEDSSDDSSEDDD